jgi:glycosyltransferase involved in cell wall biosynthesis
MGFSAALNRGLIESTGDLIGFIGQDDIWLRNKILLQLMYLIEHRDVYVVHSNYFNIDKKGKITSIRERKIPSYNGKKLIESIFIYNFIGFETALVNKRCFKELGHFDEEMEGFSDLDMWLRVFSKFKLGYMDIPLVQKRRHENQLTKKIIRSGLRDEFLIIKKAVKMYPFLLSRIKEKLSSLFYMLGIVLLQNDEIKKARKRFILSYKYRPTKVKSLFAYLLPRLYAHIWKNYLNLTPIQRRKLKWIER